MNSSVLLFVHLRSGRWKVKQTSGNQSKHTLRICNSPISKSDRIKHTIYVILIWRQYEGQKKRLSIMIILSSTLIFFSIYWEQYIWWVITFFGYTFFYNQQLTCLAFSLRFWPKIKQLLSNCPASNLTILQKQLIFAKTCKINH